MDKIPNSGEYVAPEINVIEIKGEGVLCQSGSFVVPDPFGGGTDPEQIW
jgi:hypothetical protein